VNKLLGGSFLTPEDVLATAGDNER
jgi:hypothetical protein